MDRSEYSYVTDRDFGYMTRADKYHYLMWLHSRTEHFYYRLLGWSDHNLDNENVSDGLYGAVVDIRAELARELKSLEEQIFNL